jgi:hypothetical protein
MVVRYLGTDFLDGNEARLRSLVRKWAKAEGHPPEAAHEQLMALAQEPDNRHNGYLQNFVWLDYDDDTLLVMGYAALKASPAGLELAQEWTERKDDGERAFYSEIDRLTEELSEKLGLPIMIVSRRAVEQFQSAERVYTRRGFVRMGVVYAKPPKVPAEQPVSRETAEVG